MPVGELITRWTVRLAASGYVAGLALRWLAHGKPARLKWARILWTAGFSLFVVHVLCAFHVFHHWSHQAAFETTARRTLETVGFEFGYGIYANHLFLLVWGTDAWLWWRLGISRYEHRSRWLEVAVQGYLAFIFLNGTIVFGTPVSTPLGIVGILILAVCRRLSRQSQAPADTASPPKYDSLA